MPTQSGISLLGKTRWHRAGRTQNERKQRLSENCGARAGRQTSSKMTSAACRSPSAVKHLAPKAAAAETTITRVTLVNTRFLCTLWAWRNPPTRCRPLTSQQVLFLEQAHLLGACDVAAMRFSHFAYFEAKSLGLAIVERRFLMKEKKMKRRVVYVWNPAEIIDGPVRGRKLWV